MVDVVLQGCRPQPLAAYLKALGVLRLVGEQVDAAAGGRWEGEHFVLTSSLDADGLVQFFATGYAPTPIVAPWNGGSGFYPKDGSAREAVDKILSSTSPRLEPYRRALQIGRQFVADHASTERPTGDEKALAVSTLRARLPDEAVTWLDAAVVLGDGELMFPPLLGTGGNDGRLDFSANFMQRVVETQQHGGSGVAAALFDHPAMHRFQGAMGQFLPAAHERTNPWDFLLLIEGALLFAGATTRRLESRQRSKMVFPFHARAAGGAATLADGDEAESRNEIWLPLWSTASTLREVRWLLGEGRACIGQEDRARPARTGLDFARAVARLGVDRGLSGFERIGFHLRNGRAYFATPLGRFPTRSVPAARLLDELDAWFTRLRRAASSDRAPAAVRRVTRRLEDAMFDVAAGSAPSRVLLALADVESQLARSLPFAHAQNLRPAPRLSVDWLAAIDDSIEMRLGAAMAVRGGSRRRMLPLDPSGWQFASATDNGVVFAVRPLCENLHALLRRDDVEEKTPQDLRVAVCSLEDVAAFIDGSTDDEGVERWARALSLFEPVDCAAHFGDRPHPAGPRPPAAFAVLATVLRGVLADGTPVPRTATLLSRATAGDAIEATRVAIARLRACGRPLPCRLLFEPVARMRRIAAALAFPLAPSQYTTLERQVLPRPETVPAVDVSKEHTHADTRTS